MQVSPKNRIIHEKEDKIVVVVVVAGVLVVDVVILVATAVVVLVRPYLDVETFPPFHFFTHFM